MIRRAIGAYPRWRGGTTKLAQLVTRLNGLSPLARGNPQRARHRDDPQGPIPAGAGEPRRRYRPGRCCRAYPRWRGGTVLPPVVRVVQWGLSPLARGNQPQAVHQCGAHGPIPAGAGEPPCAGPAPRQSRAYPRWRGGPRHVGGGRGGGAGPIPGGAGEPLGRLVRNLFSGAYPRWRGGTAKPTRASSPPTGLSPLARGNRPAPATANPPPGPIPAGAGEPQGHQRSHPSNGAYPRWRGGTWLGTFTQSSRGGLSPLARGNRCVRRVGLLCTGPIPAGAGEPVQAEIESHLVGAYPRWRGGTEWQLRVIQPEWGLSPLARGNLGHC